MREVKNVEVFVQCGRVACLRVSQPLNPGHYRIQTPLSHFYGLTAWIAAASLLTFPDVMPATDILPSLVA
jgi:hypothetical protein